MKTRKLTAGEVAAMGAKIGLSYGKYVALYGDKLTDHTPDEAKKPVIKDGIKKKQCRCCGKIFETTNGYKRYCCDECRIKHLDRLKRERKRALSQDGPILCAWCGKEFVKEDRRQKYCSDTCARKIGKAKRKQRMLAEREKA